MKDSEIQYRALYENALVGLWTSQIEGGAFIRANDTAAKIAGYENAEDLMNNCDAIKLFDYVTRVEFIRELREHGVKSGFEAVLIDKNNNIKEISVSGKIDLEKGTIEGVFIDISDLKEAEKALKESEENYRRITEQSLMGIVIFQEGYIKYINKAFAEIAEYSIEEIKNWPKNEFAKKIHPDDLPVVMQQMQEKIIGGLDRTARYRCRIIAKSGGIKWIEIYSKSILYEEKIAILSTAIEITERINTEQRLLDSEEKFRTITEQALMGITILQDNVVKYVNKQFADILGFSVEEIKSWEPAGFIKTIYPEDREIVMKHAELRQAGLYDDINHYFYRGLTKTGEIVWFEVYAKTITYKGRSADLVTILDITETREAEDKVRQSEEKYRDIIENTKEGYFEVDLKGNMTFFNDALREWSGYSVNELMGLNFRNYMTEKNAERTFKVFNEVHNTGIAQKLFQYEFIRKEGKILYGESSVYLRYDSNGNKIGFSGFLRDITDKIDAERKLKETEENYHSIFDSSPDYIYLTDMRGDFLEANQALLDRIKLPLDELRGLNFIDFFAGDNLPEILEILKDIRYGKEVKGLDVRAKTLFGEIFDLEVNSVPITEHGKVTKVISIARDVTGRKIAEQKLKESEEKYRDMIYNLDLGFYQVKWDGIILNVNPEFRTIMGYRQSEDLIDKNITDFWRSPEDLKKYTKELLKNNSVDNYVALGQNRYGEELILITDSHLIKDENGKPIRVEGTVADITEKYKLEQKLKTSEERYRYLFENSPFAIILSDSKGILRDANPSTEELIGYKREEIVGRTFTNLSIVHPDYLPTILERFSRNIQAIPQPHMDVQFYHKDGRLLWAHFVSTTIKIGNEFFIQVLAHDITERKKAELLIKEEIEKLKELDQIRKDLISRVSHELKTPLIPVMGGAELLLHSYKDQFEDEPLEIIEMIEKGGNRLAKLVEKLLDITKIEYEKFELEKERTNLSEIVRVSVRQMKYLIDKREIDLNLVVPDDFYMEIDGFRIEQVLTNLISNGIKNTPPKGRIGIVIEKIGNWAIISVSDTGVGFTEDEMKQLFTRFGKFERYGEGLEYIDMEGSGLGLYISKQIVDLHKGKIWVESTGRNRGCIIKVRLPIK